MKPIRVLQVVTIMNRGGLETMLMNYFRKVDRNFIQFDFMVHRSEKGHYDDEIRRLGGKIIIMPPIKPGNYLKYFRKLDQFFFHNPHYKVVHAHNNENSGFVLRAAKKAGVPCRIAHSHLSDLQIDYKLPFRLYARSVIKRSPNHFFACSDRAGNWLFGKNDAKKITVLNNAVNTEEFKPNPELRSKVRKELDIKDQLVIGHIGRFNKQKNHDYLIDIFHAVSLKKPDSLLLLAGDGDLRMSIEKKVQKLGIIDNVRFLGVREDIPELLQAFDLFLFPSLFEGLPVVLVEAQAAGLPCIISNTITKETEITSAITFMDLKAAPAEWAKEILHTSIVRQDTSEQLIRRGYDAGKMAGWLTNYYQEFYIEREVVLS